MAKLMVTAEALAYVLDFDSSVEITNADYDPDHNMVLLEVDDPEDSLNVSNDTEWHLLHYGTDGESGVVVLKGAQTLKSLGVV